MRHYVAQNVDGKEIVDGNVFLWTEVFGEFEKLAQKSFPNSSAQNMLP